MLLFLLGLILFLAVHSVRVFAEGWRTQMVARIGALPWKAAYSVVSLAGFVLLVYGYGLTREAPTVLWSPPVWTRHLAALLTIPAFVMVVAAYVPGNGIKCRLKHPMMLGIKTWALAHLLANGTLADVLLFGSFLAWAVLVFRAARGRDRAAGTVYPAGSAAMTGVTIAAGLVAWAVFAMWAHRPLIGVGPFG